MFNNSDNWGSFIFWCQFGVEIKRALTLIFLPSNPSLTDLFILNNNLFFIAKNFIIFYHFCNFFLIFVNFIFLNIFVNFILFYHFCKFYYFLPFEVTFRVFQKFRKFGENFEIFRYFINYNCLWISKIWVNFFPNLHI